MNKRKAMELAQELKDLVANGKVVEFKEVFEFDGISDVKLVNIFVDSCIKHTLIKEKFSFLEYALKMKGGIKLG